LQAMQHFGFGYWAGLSAAIAVGIGGMIVPERWQALWQKGASA